MDDQHPWPAGTYGFDERIRWADGTTTHRQWSEELSAEQAEEQRQWLSAPGVHIGPKGPPSTEHPIVRWLTGVLDNTERVAIHARDHEPHSEGEWVEQSDRVIDVGNGWDITADLGHGTWAKHIADHDPRAVLARVEAERVILALHEGERYGTCATCTETGSMLAAGDSGSAAWPCDTVKLLAYGHRFDAPGWRAEWAPEGEMQR
jgi:uncharacterized protein (DUF2249 family)